MTPLGELSRSDLQGWAELAEAAVEPNPFLHPDFVGLAATALRPRGLQVLRCEDAGGWAACLPVVPVAWRRDVLGPGLATWRHAYCYLGTPLVATGAVAEGTFGLLDGVRSRRGAAFLACDWVREGPVAQALDRVSPSRTTTDRFARGFVERSAVPAPSRKRAKELRRQRRGLAGQLGGEAEYVVHEDITEAARRFLALEAEGWKGRSGTALASRAGHAAFFVALCESFAARGAVQLVSLRGGGRTASMQCNLRARDGIFCFKVAYDEGLASHSPGALLETEALERLADDERTAWMDSCAAPDNALINRLWPQRTSLSTVVMPTGALGRGAVAASAPALRAAREARRRLRSGRPAPS